MTDSIRPKVTSGLYHFLGIETKCDLCDAHDIETLATHETVTTHTEFAGSLLPVPRQLFYCAECAAQVETS